MKPEEPVTPIAACLVPQFADQSASDRERKVRTVSGVRDPSTSDEWMSDAQFGAEGAVEVRRTTVAVHVHRRISVTRGRTVGVFRAETGEIVKQAGPSFRRDVPFKFTLSLPRTVGDDAAKELLGFEFADRRSGTPISSRAKDPRLVAPRT